MLIGLGGVVSVDIALYRGLRSELAAMRSELKAEIAAWRIEFRAEAAATGKDTNVLENRVAGLDQE